MGVDFCDAFLGRGVKQEAESGRCVGLIGPLLVVFVGLGSLSSRSCEPQLTERSKQERSALVLKSGSAERAKERALRGEYDPICPGEVLGARPWRPVGIDDRQLAFLA